MQGPVDRLDGVRGALRALSLSEEDLNAGVVMARISDLRAGVNHLTLTLGGSEQWLIEWLTKEHAKGCVLYAAAKINKSRNGPLDTSPADPRSREFIMGRFNDWVSDFLARLDDYEASCRQPGVVAPWIEAADAFPDDPKLSASTHRIRAAPAAGGNRDSDR